MKRFLALTSAIVEMALASTKAKTQPMRLFSWNSFRRCFWDTMTKTISIAALFLVLRTVYGLSWDLSETDSVALDFTYTNRMKLTMACTFRLDSVPTNGLCTIMGITDKYILKLGLVISNGRLGTYQVMSVQTMTNTIDVIRPGIEYNVVVPFSSYDALPFVFVNGQRRVTSGMLYPSIGDKITNHQYHCFIGNSHDTRFYGIDGNVSRVIVTNAALGFDFVTEYSGYGPAVTLSMGRPYCDSSGQSWTQITVANYRGVATNIVSGSLIPSCNLGAWVHQIYLNCGYKYEPSDCAVPNHSFNLYLTNTLPLKVEVPFYGNSRSTNLWHPCLFWKAIVNYER